MTIAKTKDILKDILNNHPEWISPYTLKPYKEQINGSLYNNMRIAGVSTEDIEDYICLCKILYIYSEDLIETLNNDGKLLLSPNINLYTYRSVNYNYFTNWYKFAKIANISMPNLIKKEKNNIVAIYNTKDTLHISSDISDLDLIYIDTVTKSNLNTLYIDGPTFILNNSLKQLNHLEHLIINNCQKHIGNTFSGLSSLKKIEFKDIDTLTPYMFSDCNKLKEVIIEGNVVNLEFNCFSISIYKESPITDITIKADDLSYLNLKAFDKCSNLKNFTVSKNLLTDQLREHILKIAPSCNIKTI